MSITQRKNGRWVAQVYDRQTGRMRQVGTFDTERQARRREAVEMTASTATTQQQRETVGSFADRWLDVFPRPKQSTMVHNSERIAGFVDAHRRQPLDGITMEQARTWVLAHPSTHSAIRAMFNNARQLGLVTNNPFSAMGIVKRTRGRRDLPGDWLPASEVDRIAELAVTAYRDDYGLMMRAMILFAAYTGLRPGELYALDWSHLQDDAIYVKQAADSKTRTITTPKNGHADQCPYPRRAREALEQMARIPAKDGRPEIADRVFLSPSGTQLWAPHFSILWNPVRVAFGRPEMSFYEFRHFCATNLLERGVSASDVAVQLRHVDNGALVMNTYGHPSKTAARARILAAIDGELAA